MAIPYLDRKPWDEPAIVLEQSIRPYCFGDEPDHPSQPPQTLASPAGPRRAPALACQADEPRRQEVHERLTP